MNKLLVLFGLIFFVSFSAFAGTFTRSKTAVPVDPCAAQKTAYNGAHSATEAKLVELQNMENGARIMKEQHYILKEEVERSEAYLAQLQATAQGHYDLCVRELGSVGVSSAASTCLGYDPYENALAEANAYADYVEWLQGFLANLQQAFESRWAALGRLTQEHYALTMAEAEKLVELQSCQANSTGSAAS